MQTSSAPDLASDGGIAVSPGSDGDVPVRVMFLYWGRRGLTSSARPLTIPSTSWWVCSGQALRQEAQPMQRAGSIIGWREAGSPLRVSLLRLAAADHLLLLTMHHIVSDGWSIGVLVRELTSLYDGAVVGQPVSLPALPIQYVDYAHWQREWLQGAVLDEQLGYWRDQLADAPALLELPTDRPRPAVQRSTGATFTLPIVEVTLDDVRGLDAQLTAAAGDAPTPYTEADLVTPTAIAIGAEDAGLPPAWRATADLELSIPLHARTADSLNAATAAAIILFEAVRQRGGARAG